MYYLTVLRETRKNKDGLKVWEGPNGMYFQVTEFGHIICTFTHAPVPFDIILMGGSNDFEGNVSNFLDEIL